MRAPIAPLGWSCTPLEALAAWPVDQPLCLLHSGRLHRRFARWSILASPGVIFRFDAARGWNRTGPARLPRRFEPIGDPRVDIDRLLETTRGIPRPPPDDAGLPESLADGSIRGMPSGSGWIGWLSYDLSPWLEPALRRPGAEPRGGRRPGPWPLLELGWCPDALAYDHSSRRWYALGGAAGAEPRGRRAGIGTFRAGPIRGDVEPDRYLDMVGRAIRYIAAGDIFQANVCHRLSAPFHGSTRALAACALAASRAWYGAYLELPGGRCILSLSPELYLAVRPGPRGTSVMTRPVKGTRPSRVPRGELMDSVKDQAELNMIVDLMRNDLGRVCAFGSVLVAQARTIETHPTVHHGVAEVCGTLRPGTTVGDLLAASFPAGSVTGAPKIRAMQIIDELEPLPRGPYCGAIGWLGDSGAATLNVAIRTLVLTGLRPPGAWDRLEGVLHYGVGGGIVADSRPQAEYRETLDKAAILRRVLRSGAPSRAPSRAGRR
jgi:para-aminobenzoate synthetase component 1